MNATAQLSAIAPLPRRRTQAERTEETRRRILDAGAQVLAAKGYAGLRTAEVAEVAGVSRGAQTHHFPSKDDLVLAIVEHLFSRAADLGQQRAQRVKSMDAVLQALLTDSHEFYFSELFLIAVDLAIQGRSQPSGGAAVPKIAARSRVPVEASWQSAMTEAGFPADEAEDLLWLTTSVVRGLAVRRLWQDDPQRVSRLFKLWRRMVATHLHSRQPTTAPAIPINQLQRSSK